ncbi:TonB-dependent receptor [Ferrimonas pelagia]|uniref:TonB-dependent receptor n=1 Tax=Ferrimonas pelagia TaxID=1177826 RepID=A0ABP9FH82_9GAMM
MQFPASKLSPIAAFLVVMFQGGGLAYAAEADASTDKVDEDIEVIRVTGTRASLADAINEKRFSDAQIDVISAEDIGVMPDADIGDSLERVSGVQIDRSEGGTAREVNIRGMPGYFTKTLYNGRTITTALNPNRNFSYDIMPSAFISRVSVQKSTSADLEEGGISGTVNMQSHRALDRKQAQTRVIGRTTYQGNSGEPGVDLSFIHTNPIIEDTLGIAFGLNYMDQTNASQKIENNPLGTGRYYYNTNPDNPEDGEKMNAYGTSQTRAVLQDNVRERAAGFINMQWNPSDNLSLWAESLYTNYKSSEHRQRHVFNLQNEDITNWDGYTVGDTTYVTSADFEGVRNWVEDGPISKDTNIFLNTLEATYTVGDWTFDAGLSSSRSDQDWDNMMLLTDLDAMDMTFDWGTAGNGDPVRYTYNTAGMAEYLSNPGSYGRYDPNVNNSGLRLAGPQLGSTQETNASSVNLDITHDFYRDYGLLAVNKIRFGFSYAREESLTSKHSLHAQMDHEQVLGLLAANGYDESLIRFITAQPGSGGWFNSLNQGGTPYNYLTPDAIHFRDHISVYDVRDYASNITLANGNKMYQNEVSNLIEDNFAAYLRTDFSLGYDMSGNMGVRFIHTDQLQQGVGADLTQGLVEDRDGSLILRSATDQFVDREHQYWWVLPSMNLRYSLRDDMTLRFGYGRSLSRPNKNDLNLNTNFNFNDGSPRLNTTDPDLMPFTADNIDVSWEWYYNPESMLAAAYFYKDVDSLIHRKEQDISMDVFNSSGAFLRSENVTLIGPTNGDGVVLQGFEVAYRTPFTFLPGLLSNMGMDANYTFTENSNQEVLTAASRHNANMSLYYSVRKFDVRASFSYRSERLNDIYEMWDQANNNQADKPATYSPASQRLTVNMSYRPTPKLRFNLGLSNVTDAGSGKYAEGGWGQNYNDFGRTISAGVTVNL